MGRESSRDTTNSGVGIQAGRSDPLLGHHHESTTAGCELCGKTRLQDIYDKKIQGCTAPVITSGHPGRTGQKARRQKAKRGRQKANREGNKDTKNDRHYVEHINREWQLDGLSKQQKDTIRAGEHPSLWTAPALGLKMATRLRLLLDKLKRLTDTNYSGGSHTDHVLMPTAGAGGTTIAMSLVFENVSAGDFCPAQLAALRHNICGVMHLDGVSVDKKPMNLLTRPDLSQYTAIAIEPLWGGSKFSEVRPAGCHRPDRSEYYPLIVLPRD